MQDVAAVELGNVLFIFVTPYKCPSPAGVRSPSRNCGADTSMPLAQSSYRQSLGK